MNLVILIPVIIIALALILYFSSRTRHKTGGSGLGDRSDATERPELRGSEQWKDRQL